jgi:purine-nucleoside phosphorylase
VSIHIGAKPGQIAPTVLLPGDPLRAKHFAETLLENPVCFSRVRGMLGFTGNYQGKRVSIMGTGMGVPSLSIYVNELTSEYGAETLIRVGTCGALQPQLPVGAIVLALSASTDSHVNRLRFRGMDFAPTASSKLLLAAIAAAGERNVEVHLESVFTSDTFYHDDPNWWRWWAEHGVLAVEMETAGLYTLAAKFGVNALSILTVSDRLTSEEAATARERETRYTQMAQLALDIAP